MAAVEGLTFTGTDSMDGCDLFLGLQDVCPYFHSLPLNSSPGPGIASTVKTGEEVGFVVDAKTAGKGKVTCTVLTPDGTEAEADVIENEDGTYDIFYTAAKPGTYVIYVRFGGVDIPNSPFTVMVREIPSPEHAVIGGNCNSCHLLNLDQDILFHFFFPFGNFVKPL